MTDVCEGKYGFDDAHIGWLKPSGRSLSTQDIHRPPGLSRNAWYTYAGGICTLLNSLKSESASLKHQRDLLGTELGKLLIRLDVMNPMPATGQELLNCCPQDGDTFPFESKIAKQNNEIKKLREALSNYVHLEEMADKVTFFRDEMVELSRPAVEALEGEHVEDHPPYITVTSGLRGWNAVLVTWDEGLNEYEPFVTSPESHQTRDLAIQEAQEWGKAEEITCRVHDQLMPDETTQSDTVGPH